MVIGLFFCVRLTLLTHSKVYTNIILNLTVVF